AGDVVDAAVEVGHAGGVDGHVSEIARRAAEQSDHVVDGALHLFQWHGFARTRKPPQHAIAGRVRRAFRQLHAGNAALAPHDPGGADRSFEYRIGEIAHDTDISLDRTSFHP